MEISRSTIPLTQGQIDDMEGIRRLGETKPEVLPVISFEEALAEARADPDDVYTAPEWFKMTRTEALGVIEAMREANLRVQAQNRLRASKEPWQDPFLHWWHRDTRPMPFRYPQLITLDGERYGVAYGECETDDCTHREVLSLEQWDSELAALEAEK